MSSGSTLLWTAVLIAGAAGVPGAARAADGVAVEVVSVLATNSGRAFDPRLRALQPHFVGLPYSSYRVLRRQTRHVIWGGLARFNLPGPGELKVRPKARERAGIALNVGLRGDQRRPLVDTELCLQDHRVLLVGGLSHGDGVLIVVVGAAAGTGRARQER